MTGRMTGPEDRARRPGQKTGPETAGTGPGTVPGARFHARLRAARSPFGRAAAGRRHPRHLPLDPDRFHARFRPEMPYRWTEDHPEALRRELRLWPHQSLPPAGFAATVLGLFALSLLPMAMLLGSALLWAVLPFVLLALAGIWTALRRSQRDRCILEVLTLTETAARLERIDPQGRVQAWECNRYWARAELHAKAGPVPHYVTLKGGGREVEIGAFLSEEERKALFDDLRRALPLPPPARTG